MKPYTHFASLVASWICLCIVPQSDAIRCYQGQNMGPQGVMTAPQVNCPNSTTCKSYHSIRKVQHGFARQELFVSGCGEPRKSKADATAPACTQASIAALDILATRHWPCYCKTSLCNSKARIGPVSASVFIATVVTGALGSN